MSILEILQFTIVVCTLLGLIIAAYKSYKDPGTKNGENINLLKQQCQMKHRNIDKDISLIKDNHLAHIEKDIANLNQNQVKIFTILEERLPRKK